MPRLARDSGILRWREAVSLWGRDLYQYLSDIYTRRARFCVVFLSKEYAEKLWTRHELKAVQARAFKESEEYLLPARFDETSVPGLLPTIAYVDLKSLSPEAFAELVRDEARRRVRCKPGEARSPRALTRGVASRCGHLR
jgi:hypothetical protein